MYEAYYGFSEKPFALSPDPKYLYLSQTHREVLGHLVYGIEEGEGFMAISGEVGTGKTTLCRTLLERLAESCEIAFLFNPTLTPTDLIKAINAEFGLSTFGDSRAELIDVLNTFLLEQHDEGRRVLVIIDEAQNLPTDTLEQLRLLGNLESQTSKLLQILLLGQPELDTKLEANELRQLRQRISVWWRLEPLQKQETREYIRHRLRLASGTSRPFFDERALASIHALSGGVPRVINVLADRSLLASFGEDADQVDAATVATVANEIRPPRAHRLPLPQQPREWLATGAGVLALAILGAWIIERVPRAEATSRVSAPPAARSVSTEPPDVAAAPAPLRVQPPLPARGDAFDQILGAIDADTSRATAVRALAALWQRRVDDTRPIAPQNMEQALRSAELEPLQLATFEVVIATDTPAIVTLVTTGGTPRAALLRRVEGEQALLEGLRHDRAIEVPLREIRQRWADPAVSAFHNAQQLPERVALGSPHKPAVRWIQTALERAGLRTLDPIGVFGAETQKNLVELQRMAGLPTTGEADAATQLLLYSAHADEANLPSLGGDNFSNAASVRESP